MQRSLRLKRELHMLAQNPSPGISCWQDENQINVIHAQIIGSDGTPYAGGIFSIEVSVPDRYPFEPPKARFMTPIYHPNIDSGGRICLDTLKMPPQGAWKPSLNIGSILTTIQLLMSEPNPDDPLMADISAEYKFDKPMFTQKAIEHTRQHAFGKSLFQNPHRESCCSSDDDQLMETNSTEEFPQCSGHTSNSRKRLSKDLQQTNNTDHASKKPREFV
nr:ubiquitin-conjugating enzyme E2 T-like [Ciona intestinalis]|eukprot:XP_002130052.1 ubiquitin-conjugating enzyme E2 T-like [Ciona intestinalis]